MTSGKWLYVLILVANCVLSAFSQVLLKKASLKEYGSALRQYLNALVICGYGLFFVVLMVNVYLLRFLPLSVLNPVAETLPIVLSFVSGRLLFGERITVWKIIGGGLIMLGMIVILL